MNTGREVLFFFSVLGAFNGLILSGYFLFFTRKKLLSNYFLGALLFALSIRIGKSVFLYFDPTLPKIYLQIGLSACFLIGPSLYYFIKSTLEQITKIPKKWKWDITILLAAIILIGIIVPYATYPKIWNLYFVKIIYAQWLAFIIMSAFELKVIFKKIFVTSQNYTKDNLKANEKWLLTIFGGNIAIFISFALSLVTEHYPLYISGSIAFSFILYLVIFILLYRKKTDDFFTSTRSKYGYKKVNKDDANLFIETLRQTMVEKKLYQNANLTLNELAKVVKLPGHQLSQLLNENLGKNFTTFINEYRINEACNMITSVDHLTLEAIGYEVGFNSKSTFFSTFKKLKGTTPAIYQQNASK